MWLDGMEAYFKRARQLREFHQEWSVVIVSSRNNGLFVEYETLATHHPTHTVSKAKQRFSGLLKVGF
jgi:hypothetical protein